MDSASISKHAIPLPWQSGQWQRFLDLLSADRLPHAILLGGAPGTGKLQFALALSNYLMCLAPVGALPCHQCRGCQLFEAGTHPDFRWLRPEEEGKRIKVDTVRLLVDFLSRTSQRGGQKVAIMCPADSMNTNASNALLKSLEEPSAGALLLLVSDHPARLLPTIRSRCQLMTLPMPSPDESLAWLARVLNKPEQAERLLKESSGQPLTALKLMESGGVELAGKLDKDFYLMVSGRLSAVALAEQWLEHEIVDVLRWLLARTQGVIRYLQADMPLDKPWSLMSVSNCMDLFGFLDTLSILMLKIDQGAVPNRQLVLEDILFQSCDIYHHQ